MKMGYLIGNVLGMALGNILLVAPIFILVTIIANKVVKNEKKIGLVICAICLGILITITALLESLTTANIVIVFIEIILLNQLRKTRYFAGNKEEEQQEEIKE